MAIFKKSLTNVIRAGLKKQICFGLIESSPNLELEQFTFYVTLGLSA